MQVFVQLLAYADNVALPTFARRCCDSSKLQQRVCCCSLLLSQCCGPVLGLTDERFKRKLCDLQLQVKFFRRSIYSICSNKVKKGKVFPYSLPSVGPGADPGVQAVSPQVT